MANETVRRTSSAKSKAAKKKKKKRIVIAVTCLLLAAVCGIVIYVVSFITRMLNNMHEDNTAPYRSAEATKKRIINGIGDGDDQTEGETSDISRPEIIETQPNQTEPQLPEDILEGMKGYLTIAAFGIDGGKNLRFDPQANGGKGDWMDWMSGDVNMLVCVNLETYEVKLVSVYRDTYLQINDDTYDKLTDIFTRYSYYNGNSAKAGGQYTMQCLNRNLDLNMENYVVVDWSVISDVVDMMGGLEVPVSQLEAGAMNGFITETCQVVGKDSTTLEGTYSEDKPTLLDGVQTVAYCRIRNVGNSDYARTERQREVIGLMLQKAKGLKISKLLDIVEVASQEIYTNMDDKTIMSLATHILRNPRFNIVDTTGFPYKPVWTEYYEGYIYSRDVCSEVTQLHQYLYGDMDFRPSPQVHSVEDFINHKIQTDF